MDGHHQKAHLLSRIITIGFMLYCGSAHVHKKKPITALVWLLSVVEVCLTSVPDYELPLHISWLYGLFKLSVKHQLIHSQAISRAMRTWLSLSLQSDISIAPTGFRGMSLSTCPPKPIPLSLRTPGQPSFANRCSHSSARPPGQVCQANMLAQAPENTPSSRPYSTASMFASGPGYPLSSGNGDLWSCLHVLVTRESGSIKRLTRLFEETCFLAYVLGT